MPLHIEPLSTKTRNIRRPRARKMTSGSTDGELVKKFIDKASRYFVTRCYRATNIHINLCVMQRDSG